MADSWTVSGELSDAAIDALASLLLAIVDQDGDPSASDAKPESSSTPRK